MIPKLSIIIPVYNVEPYLEACLKPLINSTQKDFEVILIDDGSNDGSDKICAEYANIYNFIKFIPNKHKGVSAARNIGIKEARGEWVAFIDSDDLVCINYLDILMELIKNTDFDIIIFKYLSFTSKEEIKNKILNKHIYDPKKFQKITQSEKFDSLLKTELGSYAWNRIYKRSLYLKIKYPEKEYFEDISTTYRLMDISKNIALYNEILYFYRQRQNTIMHQKELKGELKLRYYSIISRYRLFKKLNSDNSSFQTRRINNHILLDDSIDLLKMLAVNKSIDKNKYIHCLDYLNSFKFSRKRDGLKNMLKIQTYIIYPKLFNTICILLNNVNKNQK